MPILECPPSDAGARPMLRIAPTPDLDVFDVEKPVPHACPEIIPVAFDQIAGRDWLSWSFRRAAPSLMQLLLFSPDEWSAIHAEDRPSDARDMGNGWHCALRYLPA